MSRRAPTLAPGPAPLKRFRHGHPDRGRALEEAEKRTNESMRSRGDMTLEELEAAAKSELEASLDEYQADLVEQLVAAGRADQAKSSS